MSRRLGKPAKWTETRSESLVAAHHGRDQWQKLTLAARSDGTVTGLKVELLADRGAYLGLVTPGVPILGDPVYPTVQAFDDEDFTIPLRLTSTGLDFIDPLSGSPRSFAADPWL